MKIRQAILDDFESVHALSGYCYGFDPSNPKYREISQKRFQLIYDEYYSIEDDEGRIIGNTRLLPFEQNLRGAWKKMGGIAMVTSAPETRRRGYIRELMIYLFKKMHEANFAFSTLYPFKDTFYGTFGYVNGPTVLKAEVNPALFQRWRKLPSGYRVERMPYSEGAKFFREIHEKAIQGIHGAVRRSTKRWEEFDVVRRDWFAVTFAPPGTPEGIMRYRNKGFATGFEWAEEGTMNILDFYYLTPKARQSLFNYIFLHADQIVKAILPMNPNESQYLSWIEGFCNPRMQTGTILMARIINVKHCLQNLPVPSDGQIQLKITDSHCSWNNQTFKLVGAEQKLTVEAQGDKESLIEMSIEGLSALVFGTLTVTDLESFNWLKGANEEQKRLLEKWFPLQTPWMMEFF